jgi:hypothetical protein
MGAQRPRGQPHRLLEIVKGERDWKDPEGTMEQWNEVAFRCMARLSRFPCSSFIVRARQSMVATRQTALRDPSNPYAEARLA